jgi:hypothetical protein
VHLFKFVGSLTSPTERTAAVLEFRPPASIFVVAASPVALSSVEASTCGEKEMPRLLFVFFKPHAPPTLARRRLSALWRHASATT